ncbi:hypothetical protein BLNAU_19874 [Blattamonas nauphoetae]|uniref:Uncharacterized protein n=1 Tax=Blattamonas nauphoetae TaxID=2049346 RepID=A0ABQ9X0A2_9EUKA|nr:hypothetical protein BLNAU_19874 [Blattamonas nauphoetae]
MYPNPSVNEIEKHLTQSPEGHTLQSVLDELMRRERDVRVFVNSSTWLNVPAVIRSWKEGDGSEVLKQLLEAVDEILKQTCDENIPIMNKHLLHSSLSSLAQNASLAKNVRMRVTHCLVSLESVVEGPFVMMEREEIQAMVREMEELRFENGELKRQNEEQTSTIHAIRRQKEEEHSSQHTKVGAAAIDIFTPFHYSLSDNTFTAVVGGGGCLVSFEFGAVVARLSLIVGCVPNNNYSFGIVSKRITADALKTRFHALKEGVGGWDLFPSNRAMWLNGNLINQKKACEAGAAGQRVVIEADGREGRRTVRMSQDGVTQPAFFTNIPVPFRFAVYIGQQNDSVTIESVEVVKEAQMEGGTIPVQM